MWAVIPGRNLMSYAPCRDELRWDEIDGQRVELLPARTVLSAGCGAWHFGGGGDGGPASDGGYGGWGFGGEAGDGGDATVEGNVNNGFIQVNVAIGGPGGYGGEGDGGDAAGGDADSGEGDGSEGDGGDAASGEGEACGAAGGHKDVAK